VFYLFSLNGWLHGVVVFDSGCVLPLAGVSMDTELWFVDGEFGGVRIFTVALLRVICTDRDINDRAYNV